MAGILITMSETIRKIAGIDLNQTLWQANVGNRRATL
jgi:hypothetical protein